MDGLAIEPDPGGGSDGIFVNLRNQQLIAVTGYPARGGVERYCVK